MTHRPVALPDLHLRGLAKRALHRGRAFVASTASLATAALSITTLLAACGGDHVTPYTPGGVATVPAFAASAGAQGVVVADAPLPRPPSTPCTIALFDGVAFRGFDAHAFGYAGSSACAGTPAKIVLEADFSVNAGRQFDRTASIAIGGVNLYFGTTQEPSATVAPSWHVERDVTEYANALVAAATGSARLDNLVDGTYTGILTGSARLVFYPAAANVEAATPRIADMVIPFAGDLTNGDPASVTASGLPLQRTLSLPTNLVRVYFDIQAESQAGDEFWQTCVPNALTGPLQSCGGGAFREVMVSVDGQPAGIAPVVPRVYTGGLDPGLWRPTPDVETLNFIPSRVDLTPYAGALSDGKPHTVAITVEGAQDHFAVVGNLLLYRDAGAATTGGAIATNTLDAALTAPVATNTVVVSADGTAASGPLGVTASRSYAIEGYVQTSAGKVTTRVEHVLAFSNQQTFAIDTAAYTQNITQTSTDSGTVTTTQASGAQTVDTIALSYPITLAYTFDNASVTQVSKLTQSITNDVTHTVQGRQLYASSYSNAVQSGSTANYGGAAAVRTGQQSTQSVHFTDTFGSCYDRQVTTAGAALASATDGAACGGHNSLNWLSPVDGSAPQGVFAQISAD